MYKVNWDVFNTPFLRYTVVEFANGVSFKDWIDRCVVSKEAQKEIRKLRTYSNKSGTGITAARARAKRRAKHFVSIQNGIDNR